MDDLGTVRTLHQGERRVPRLVLIGLLTDFADCRQRKSRLERDPETVTTRTLSQQTRPKATYRKTLSQDAGLLQLPWSAKFLHVSAEVTVSALRPNAGLAALTPAARTHAVVSPECAAMLNSSESLSRYKNLNKGLKMDCLAKLKNLFNSFNQFTLLFKSPITYLEV